LPASADKLLGGDFARGERDGNRSIVSRLKHRLEGHACGGCVGRLHIGPAPTVSAARQHNLWCRRHRDIGWETRAGAVVRRHEHVAFAGRSRSKQPQRLPLDIAREEHTAAGRLERDDEARLVVAAVKVLVASEWMEHTGTAERVDRERVACPSRSHGYSPRFCRVEQIGDRERWAPEERLGHEDLANTKPSQQGRHGVEVVGIGMRDHKRVDPRDPLAPKHRLHRPAGRGRGPEPARVVHEAAARRRSYDDAAAVPNRRHHHP